MKKYIAFLEEVKLRLAKIEADCGKDIEDFTLIQKYLDEILEILQSQSTIWGQVKMLIVTLLNILFRKE